MYCMSSTEGLTGSSSWLTPQIKMIVKTFSGFLIILRGWSEKRLSCFKSQAKSPGGAGRQKMNSEFKTGSCSPAGSHPLWKLHSGQFMYLFSEWWYWDPVSFNFKCKHLNYWSRPDIQPGQKTLGDVKQKDKVMVLYKPIGVNRVTNSGDDGASHQIIINKSKTCFPDCLL